MKILKILCCMAAVCLTAFSLSGCSLHNSLGSGTISIPTYAVKAPTAGKLIGLISEKGERISKGQPLFAIGDAKLDKQVKDLATQVAKAEADLKRMQQGTPTAAPIADTSLAQANVAAAQQKAAKMNSLLAQGAVSRNQAQAAQDELQRAIAQLQAANSVSVSFKPASPAEIDAQQKLIVQLKAQQAAAIAQQEKNEGNSPCTGIITDLQTANNSTIQKDQVILHIKAVDSCSITLNVSAAQAKELKSGMSVSIKAAETPAPFSGKISSIDGTKITVTSDQKPEDLKDGVKVEISLAA